LTQFETDQEVWVSYQDRQATLAVTWSSTYFGSNSPNTALAAIPTKEGKPFTYASGWVWCVVPSTPEAVEGAVQLAEFLTRENFLSTWALEAGYLPVWSSGLNNWSETVYYATFNQLLPSAVLIPDLDLLTILGPEVRQAVVAVLKDQAVPAEALLPLLQSFGNP
jgi:ABC-type glycerol-3-phosphate transport system substrate-binding protein